MGFNAFPKKPPNARQRIRWSKNLGQFSNLPDPTLEQSDCPFDSLSWVFSGAVENVEYVASLEDTEFAIYQTAYNGDRSILTKTSDTLRISEQQRSAYSAGVAYAVSAGVLHETRRLGVTSAFTVLLTNDVSDAAPTVLGPVSGKHKYVYHRRIVPESVVEQMFEVDLGLGSNGTENRVKEPFLYHP